MKTETKSVILFVVFLLCIALAFAVLFNLDGIIACFRNKETPNNSVSSDIEKDMNTVYINGEAYYRKKTVVNYLIMGIDSFGESGDAGIGQADFIMVVSFDINDKSYTMIPINRDTMTEIGIYDVFGEYVGKRVEQIALSHAYGSSLQLSNVQKCNNTAEAVSELLYGVKFKEYVSMTMDAVCKITDFVGGVEVYMSEDWSEIDSSFAKGDTVTLDGEMALRFIRARNSLGDSTNISRMKRQKVFLEALIKKFDVLNADEEEWLEAYSQVEPYLVTASGTDMIIDIADKISSYECKGTVDLPGEAIVGDRYMEFYVDGNGVQNIVKELFFDRAGE